MDEGKKPDSFVLQKESAELFFAYATVGGNLGTGKENVENKYGIEIVKTEFKDGNINVESNEVPNITNNNKEADRILEILRDNEVTPIAMQDVLDDLSLKL